jgi:hypothetical protein
LREEYVKSFARILLTAAVVAAAVPAFVASAAAEQRQREERRGPDVPPPPPGTGQVVFYRTSSMGMLVSCRVREGDTVVNRLPPGKYFIHQTTPGVHEYNVRSEARDSLRLEVEEGETHYVRCAIGMGFGVGRPNLSPQDRADFDRRGRGLDLLPPYVPENND